MDGSFAPLPRPALDILKELRSCALDAELTRITGKWGLQSREMHLAAMTSLEPVSRKYRGIRKGGTFRESHLERLLKVYPRSRLRLCLTHPLGQVLTDPSLPREWLVRAMESLRTKRVRECILADYVAPSGEPFTFLRGWDREIVEELAEIGTLEAFFALACRMRIAQVEGDPTWDLMAHGHLLQMLPIAAHRSLHLLLGSHVLKPAVEFFLSWEPYSSMRDSVMIRSDLCFRQQAWFGLESMRLRAVKLGRIDEHVMDIRRDLAQKIIEGRRGWATAADLEKRDAS